jgi:ribosomal protein S17E
MFEIKDFESQKEIQTLIQEFRNAAIEKGDFAEAKRDHQLYEIIQNSFHQLKDLGEPGKKALENLLDDESVFVRNWIASYLIIVGNPQARKVLEEISKVSGITGFTAKMTLQEFDAGRLKLPFPEVK